MRLITLTGLGLLSMASVLPSCKGNTHKQEEAKAFVHASIPAMLLDPQERADYFAMHYWDHFDFTDTSLVNLSPYTEQAFVDYIDFLPNAAYATVVASVGQTLSNALKNKQMFGHITDLFEKYLYDPNSPHRNEELYALAVEYIIDSEQIDDVDKINFRFQWGQIQKNRQGTIANDFNYMLVNGVQGKMHRINADYLLIFLFDPECHSCGEILQNIQSSPVVTEAVQRGILKVFTVYVAQNIPLWEQYQANLPKAWISAYDPLQTIEQEKLYDLRALPTMYLLDDQKRVLIKDATVPQVDYLLGNVLR